MDAVNEDLNLDLSKKKKKPKKPFDLDALDDKQNESVEQNDKATDDLDDLNDLLSKKKKKKKKAFNLDDLENALPETDTSEQVTGDNQQNNENADGVADGDLNLGDGDLDFNLPLKKKKKKKVTLAEPDLAGDSSADPFSTDADKENQSSSNALTGQAAWVNSDRDYTYDELLDLVFNIIKEKNPEIAGERKKLVMRPPQVLRVGTKKSSFANFIDICKYLHRQPKHVQAFLLAELGTSGSVDANNQLIIKGRFQPKQIESVLKNYVKEYVLCKTCRSPETILQKDTRLFFLQCETCGSRRSVASIKSGFQAVTGKRAAIRNKQV